MIVALAAVAIALGLRVAYLVEASADPLFRLPPIDGADNIALARRVLSEGWPRGVVPFKPPGYPIFLALTGGLTGSLWVPRLVQAVLGVLTCLLLFDLGRRRFSERVGAVAALLYALYAPAAFLESLIEIDALVVPMTVVVLWLAVARPGRWWAPAAGVVLAMATFTRPTAALLVPALIVGLRLERSKEGTRPVGRGWLVVAALALLPVAAFALRNRLGAGQWVPVSANGGVNFYVGNNPDFEKVYRLQPGNEWEELMDRAADDADRSGGDSSPYFYRESFHFIASEPLSALRLFGRKALLFLGDFELGRNQSFSAHRARSAVLPLGFMRWGLLVALAAAGILLLRGRWREHALPLSVLVWVGLVNVGFFVCDRYRMPAAPVLALLSAVALVEGHRRLREAPRELLAPGVVAVLVLGLAMTDLGGARALERYRLDFYLAEALLETGRLDEATSALDRAAAIDANDTDAIALRAVILLKSSRPTDALSAADRAIGLAPSNPRGHDARGRALLALGQPAPARAAFEKALEVRKTREAIEPQVRDHLGQALFAEGRAAEARAQWEAYLRSKPADPGTKFNIGLTFEASQPEEALRWFGRALDDGDGPPTAYLHYAAALEKQQQPERAMEALRRGAVRQPRAAMIRLAIAQRLMARRDAAGAERELRAVVEAEPRNADAWTSLGVCLAALSRFPEARTAFDEALRIDPANEAARLSLQNLPR